MKLELKPCLFCGAERGLYLLNERGGICTAYEYDAVEVFCDNCKCSFKCEDIDSREELVAKWNSIFRPRGLVR